MKIEKLDWDSDFFGYDVGKIVVSENDDFDIKKLRDESNSYKLIYIFSDIKLNHSYINIVDTKLTLEKKIDNSNVLDEDSLFFYDSKNEAYEEIEALALISGKYSRFRLDKNFKNNEYVRLYKKWIHNLLLKKEQVDIIVYKTNNKIIGFTSIEEKENLLFDIGLVAVNSGYRGKGIGAKLINYATRYAYLKGGGDIQVITQEKNVPALNLYEKCGFRISKVEYIYHFWNL